MKYYAIKVISDDGKILEQYLYNVPSTHLKHDKFCESELDGFRRAVVKKVEENLNNKDSKLYGMPIESFHIEGIFVDFKEVNKVYGSDIKFHLVEPPKGHVMKFDGNGPNPFPTGTVSSPSTKKATSEKRCKTTDKS